MIVSDRLLIHLSPHGAAEVAAAGFHCRRLGRATIAWMGDDAAAGHGEEIEILDTFAAETASPAPQIFNRIAWRDDTLTIASDPLNLKPLYVARDGEEVFFASRLLDLVKLRPALARPLDREALLALLVFGHVLDEQTLHQRIRRLPADSATTWSAAAGLQTRLRHGLISDLPDVTGALARSLLTDIDAIISEHLRALPMSPGQRPVIALSGGFDSRILAARACAMNIPLHAYTYGRWRDRDAVIARWIARRLQLDHQLLPYPDDVLRRHRAHFLDVTEGQDDPSLLQIANLLSLPHPQGTVLLHGYGGGSLFGDNVSNWMHDNAQNRPALLAAIVRKAGIPAAKASALAASLGVADDALPRRVSAAAEAEAYPYHHQALMAWDLKNRQRRFIGEHFGLLGHRFKVRAPFYDARLMKLCMALPAGLLEERLLNRLYLKQFFPRLAQIPHDQEATPVLPDVKDELLMALIDKLLRPTNIWRHTLGHDDREAQRLMTESAAAFSSLMREIWDEAVDLPAAAASDQRVRKRIWGFVDYSRRLAKLI